MKIRNIVTICCLLMTIPTMGMISCKKRVEPPPESEMIQEKQPEALPTPDSEVVMVSGDLKLTMEDYNRCIAVHRIKGNMFSKRALANPRFQRDEVQRCFQVKFLQDYMQKNQLSVDPADHQAAIDRWVKLAEVKDLEELSKKLEIDPDKIHDYIDDTALLITVQKHLVKTMDDKALRQIFDMDARRMTVEIAEFDNTPTDEEVEHYIQEDEESMKKILGLHQELLNSPPHVMFMRFGYPVDARQKASNLRLLAIDKGAEAAIAQCEEDKKSGCVLLNGPDNLLDEVRTEVNAWAFRQPVGSVSEVEEAASQLEIRISQEILPPQPYHLDDLEVKKSVAREVLRNYEPADHLISAIKPALEAENVDFQAVTEQHHGQYQKLTDSYEQIGYSEAIHSPQVRSLLSGIREEEAGLFANPIVEEGKLFIVRVVQLTVPSDEDFARDRETWMARRASDPHLRMVNAWLQNSMPRMTSLNIQPIQSQYGILQPNGSIRE